MWLLDRLLAKDSRRMLVAKVLDNADVMLLLSKYLDIQSLLILLAVIFCSKLGQSKSTRSDEAGRC